MWPSRHDGREANREIEQYISSDYVIKSVMSHLVKFVYFFFNAAYFAQTVEVRCI